MSVIVTVRISKKLRDEAKAYGINISELLRRALIEELRKKRLKRINLLQENARKILAKISRGRIVEAIREIRNES